jgi:hypothetical protein
VPGEVASARGSCQCQLSVVSGQAENIAANCEKKHFSEIMNRARLARAIELAGSRLPELLVPWY